MFALRTTRLAKASLTAVACASLQYSVSSCSTGEPLVAFSPKEFKPFPITKVVDISPNTKKFTCALPSKDHEMGMTTSSMIMIKGPNSPDGKMVTRPYTPTSLNDRKGSFDLVIKTYPTGVVSKYLHSLKEGDSIEVKGPFVKMPYRANMKKKIGMIAGGTGITPMLQVIQEVLKNPQDKTEIHLVFANNTEEDILLKDELDALAAKHKNFKVTYVVSLPSQSWKGYSGFINTQVLKDCMPPPSAENLILVCGPPPMMAAISGSKTPDFKQGPVGGLLKEMSYNEDMVFKF